MPTSFVTLRSEASKTKLSGISQSWCGFMAVKSLWVQILRLWDSAIASSNLLCVFCVIMLNVFWRMYQGVLYPLVSCSWLSSWPLGCWDTVGFIRILTLRSGKSLNEVTCLHSRLKSVFSLSLCLSLPHHSPLTLPLSLSYFLAFGILTTPHPIISYHSQADSYQVFIKIRIIGLQRKCHRRICLHQSSYVRTFAGDVSSTYYHLLS